MNSQDQAMPVAKEVGISREQPFSLQINGFNAALEAYVETIGGEQAPALKIALMRCYQVVLDNRPPTAASAPELYIRSGFIVVLGLFLLHDEVLAFVDDQPNSLGISNPLKELVQYCQQDKSERKEAGLINVVEKLGKQASIFAEKGEAVLPLSVANIISGELPNYTFSEPLDEFNKSLLLAEMELIKLRLARVSSDVVRIILKNCQLLLVECQKKKQTIRAFSCMHRLQIAWIDFYFQRGCLLLDLADFHEAFKRLLSIHDSAIRRIKHLKLCYECISKALELLSTSSPKLVEVSELICFLDEQAKVFVESDKDYLVIKARFLMLKLQALEREKEPNNYDIIAMAKQGFQAYKALPKKHKKEAQFAKKHFFDVLTEGYTRLGEDACDVLVDWYTSLGEDVLAVKQLFQQYDGLLSQYYNAVEQRDCLHGYLQLMLTCLQAISVRALKMIESGCEEGPVLYLKVVNAQLLLDVQIAASGSFVADSGSGFRSAEKVKLIAFVLGLPWLRDHEDFFIESICELNAHAKHLLSENFSIGANVIITAFLDQGLVDFVFQSAKNESIKCRCLASAKLMLIEMAQSDSLHDVESSAEVARHAKEGLSFLEHFQEGESNSDECDRYYTIKATLLVVLLESDLNIDTMRTVFFLLDSVNHPKLAINKRLLLIGQIIDLVADFLKKKEVHKVTLAIHLIIKKIEEMDPDVLPGLTLFKWHCLCMHYFDSLFCVSEREKNITAKKIVREAELAINIFNHMGLSSDQRCRDQLSDCYRFIVSAYRQLGDETSAERYNNLSKKDVPVAQGGVESKAKLVLRFPVLSQKTKEIAKKAEVEETTEKKAQELLQTLILAFDMKSAELGEHVSSALDLLNILKEEQARLKKKSPDFFVSCFECENWLSLFVQLNIAIKKASLSDAIKNDLLPFADFMFNKKQAKKLKSICGDSRQKLNFVERKRPQGAVAQKQEVREVSPQSASKKFAKKRAEKPAKKMPADLGQEQGMKKIVQPLGSRKTAENYNLLSRNSSETIKNPVARQRKPGQRNRKKRAVGFAVDSLKELFGLIAMKDRVNCYQLDSGFQSDAGYPLGKRPKNFLTALAKLLAVYGVVYDPELSAREISLPPNDELVTALSKIDRPKLFSEIEATDKQWAKQQRRLQASANADSALLSSTKAVSTAVVLSVLAAESVEPVHSLLSSNPAPAASGDGKPRSDAAVSDVSANSEGGSSVVVDSCGKWSPGRPEDSCLFAHFAWLSPPREYTLYQKEFSLHNIIRDKF